MIPIIYYHSVGPINPHWKRNFLTLDLPFFEDQMRYIAGKYQSISLLDYYRIRAGELASPSNPIVITFDDGYLDNWIWAFPLLKKYNLKATIFVSPEFVDPRPLVRPRQEDVMDGKATRDDLNQWGFLSWDEMRIMEATGLVSIESHTMSHTKYPVSDKLTGFHHPNSDAVYIIGNLFPEKKPFYITDKIFHNSIAFGYPLFEMESAATAKRVEINTSFIEECTRLLAGYDFNNYNFQSAFEIVSKLYDSYKHAENLITERESEDDYLKRLQYEIAGSKKIIEEKLQKKVNFLCWPHGDNKQIAHQQAMEAGYLATTVGSKQKLPESIDRIPLRIGMYHSRNNRFLSLLKVKYKLGTFKGLFPWNQVSTFYKLLKYQRLNSN